MEKENTIITLGSVDLSYSRTGSAWIAKKAVCSITGVKTLCVCIDGSEGEYGEVNISIEHLNFKLKQHGLDN